MNKIILACVSALIAFPASAEWVQGYYRKDGTYVQPHYRAESNQYRFDNPSSQTMGGSKRDEFSTPSATNRSNGGWGNYDNDGDGLLNRYDPKPDSKCNSIYGCTR